ncbi:DNA cytosine methyltransferase, partial [Candidatus Woesearchaeota archaeon]
MSRSQVPSARSFLFRERESDQYKKLPAISLFSGAGLSDLGYELAGFQFLVHSELEPNRAELCTRNFPDSICVIGDLWKTWEEVVSKYQERTQKPPALVSVTPPCQGLSSSNPSRGKVKDPSTNDERNLLLLASIPVIKELKPRMTVVENVPQVLQRVVCIEESEEPRELVEIFERSLGSEYRIFSTLVQMADYGVPQDRNRAILVAIRADEPCVKQTETQGLLPLPRPTHAEIPEDGLCPWITLEEWFNQMDYPTLDAKSSKSARCDSDPLHFVPSYQEDRYLMVADIPPK